MPSILAKLASDVEFSFAGGVREVPWHRPWRGHDGAAKFFAALAEAVDFKSVVDEHQVHWWTLRDGKIASLTHFEDTAQVAVAVRA